METNIIHNEDCLDGMEELPNNSIDLTVTSPPYDDLREYDGYYDWNFHKVAESLFRVTKNGGVVVWIVDDTTKDFCESLSSFKQAIYFVENIGFKLLDTMIYVKESYPPAYPNLQRYANQFEYMFVLVKGDKPKTFNKLSESRKSKWKKGKKVGFRQKDGSIKEKVLGESKEHKARTNVWSFDVGFNKSSTDRISFEHPATFPEKLAECHIKTWSEEGDIVLDPFLGSGTTAKMAILNNRKYIGFEINEDYYEIAKKRINNTQMPLF